MTCLVVLEGLALYTRIDGQFFSLIVGGVMLLAGYEYGLRKPIPGGGKE